MSKRSAKKVLITGHSEALLVPDVVYERLVRILIRSVLGGKYGRSEEIKQRKVTKQTTIVAGDWE